MTLVVCFILRIRVREDGEVLGYDEEKPGNVKNITKPFQGSVNVHCTKSKEVFTLFHVNRESSEHQKEKLCAMCLETRRAGGRVIYNGFCAELNEDDGIKVDGVRFEFFLHSFSRIRTGSVPSG